MIKNYNGKVSRRVLGDLRKICDVNEKNRESLIEKLAKDGEVSFCVNLDPFTGEPDEMSDVMTLKSEAEVEDYLKKDFKERLNGYVEYRQLNNDPLVQSIVSYLTENNGIYPERNVMRELETAAEEKRKMALPETATQPISAKDKLLKEILELTEVVMEARRETNPEDIWEHVEPYDDELNITTCDDFEAILRCGAHYSRGDSTDYKLYALMKKDHMRISFLYRYDGDVSVSAEDDWKQYVDVEDIWDHIITVHKGMIEIAKNEGLEVTSEVDYEELSA